jgi:hypothetical protein
MRSEVPQSQLAEANNVYDLRNTEALVNYLHKACFNLTNTAILNAVKRGNFLKWPGLTEEAINTHFKMTPATVMGHMTQRRQNICSASRETESDV